jgi:hypothetical protein
MNIWHFIGAAPPERTDYPQQLTWAEKCRAKGGEPLSNQHVSPAIERVCFAPAAVIKVD